LLAPLTQEQRVEVLLRLWGRPDRREAAEHFLRYLKVADSTVSPGDAPGGRGDEAAPASRIE
jgi:hypothetical protein